MPYIYFYVYESIQKPHILLESRQRPACSAFRKILRLQWRTWDKSTYSNQIYSGHLEMQSAKLRSSKDPKGFGKSWKHASISQSPHHRVREFSCLEATAWCLSLKSFQTVGFVNLSFLLPQEKAHCDVALVNVSSYSFWFDCKQEQLWYMALPPQRFHLWSRTKSICQFTSPIPQRKVTLSFVRLIYVPTCSNQRCESAQENHKPISVKGQTWLLASSCQPSQRTHPHCSLWWELKGVPCRWRGANWWINSHGFTRKITGNQVFSRASWRKRYVCSTPLMSGPTRKTAWNKVIFFFASPCVCSQCQTCRNGPKGGVFMT